MFFDATVRSNKELAEKLNELVEDVLNGDINPAEGSALGVLLPARLKAQQDAESERRNPRYRAADEDHNEAA